MPCDDWMCTGKLWGDYFRSATTRNFLDVLGKYMECDIDLLVQSICDGPNSGRGTWVHRKVAIHLAQWCSPYFAVQVTNLVERYVSGKVTTEESQAAAEIVRRSAEDAEIQCRKRKMELEADELAIKERKLAMQKQEIETRNLELEMKKQELEMKKKERDMELDAKERDLDIALTGKERELAIRERDTSYKVNLYVSTFNALGIELEASDRLLLKDVLRNTMAPPGSSQQRPQSNAIVPHDPSAQNNVGAEASRVLLPISDMYRRITGTVGNKGVWTNIGKYAAQVYRSLKGREPEKVERFVDGTTRKVAAYEGSDVEWMRPLIEAYVSGALTGVPIKNVRFQNGRIVF